ncbi:MAG: sugar ABC transporter ATP-binding protein [Mesorhizobium sp.]|uniref:sugar ABC transporter ATP-binding protein n=3 Tax=unclassified Mesorhizobium TaxID=325217 RepID=UPI000FE5B275|nr:sugar ABC transporter ATP-binding protein [Mesorhizobium sp.]RWE79420.1 MAG: sugar ABC transporter ATP-binding protein [Mesorhizobium sp.]TJW63127.1 MAG: sugar ABC transporter ATP-binding protein [Mesorhizobium sp.]
MNPVPTAMAAPPAVPFVAANAISKSYGGAQALRGASLSVLPGEVHGLVGANGAGKSTLIRILAGVTQPDTGEIAIEGRPVAIVSPHAASGLGMSFIHQELAYVPDMTVLENIMLGLPKKKTRLGLVDWSAIQRDVAPIIERVGITAPLDAAAKSLSTAENWLISIARALVWKARLIVMDEPTASLSAGECRKLFSIIRGLSAAGVAVLYVSHRLDEILDLCSRVTVFRDGRSVAVLDGSGLTRRRLVQEIVGGAVEQLPKSREATGGEIVLSVRGLRRLPRVEEASFDLRRGEVLGLGGLVGAGRSELARLLYGADRPDAGTMTIEGRPFVPRTPAGAVRAGMGLVPEERRTEGLLLGKSIAFNLSLGNLTPLLASPVLPFISLRKRARLAQATIRDLSIKASSPEQPVGRLSGGNQQKVVIGRWLRSKPKVLILDEPTRGVDIGARGEIHRLIRELAGHGMAVLVISSEPDELPDLCDRVLVMAEGRIVSELAGRDLTRNAIIEASYAATEERVPA